MNINLITKPKPIKEHFCDPVTHTELFHCCNLVSKRHAQTLLAVKFIKCLCVCACVLFLFDFLSNFNSGCGETRKEGVRGDDAQQRVLSLIGTFLSDGPNNLHTRCLTLL